MAQAAQTLDELKQALDGVRVHADAQVGEGVGEGHGDGEIAGLAARAQRIAAALNALPGVTCNAAEGAMYAFPQIRLPAKALAAAQEQGRAATRR